MEEIIQKRSEKNKTFDLGNGKKRLVCYGVPIHYNKDNMWTDIDLDFTDDGKGNWIADKNKVSAGFRKDLKLEKYFGLRYDDEHQFEGSILEIELDNVKQIFSDKTISLTKKSKTEMKHKLNDDVEIINRLSNINLINFVKVNNPIEDFKIVEELHLKGFTCSNKKENNNYILDEFNRFNFVDENGKLKFWINQPFFEDNAKDHFQNIEHTLQEIDGKLIYTKIPTPEGKDDLVLAQYPILIDTNTYYSSTADGRVARIVSESWADIQSATDGTTVNDTDTGTLSFLVSSHGTGGKSSPSIIRSFFYFNTSDLGSGATVTAAILKFYTKTLIDSSIYAMKGTQASTLTTADYDSFTGSQYAIVTASNLTINVYNSLTFNSQGISDVETEGTTKICVRNYEYDVLVSDPGNTDYRTGAYYADDTSEDPIRKPRLEIDYTEASTYRRRVIVGVYLLGFIKLCSTHLSKFI